MKKTTLVSIVCVLTSFPLLGKSTIGPRLQFLINASSQGTTGLFDLPEFEQIPVTITFSHAFDNTQLEMLERAGFSPRLYRKKPLGSRRVLVGFLQKSALNQESLQSVPDVVEIETTWRPHHEYPLLLSRTQIEADQVWQMNSPPITGKNIRVADLDTGINQFHPMFFFADGDTMAWTDVNSNDQFDPGIDGVDLNNSGSISNDEILQFIQVNSSQALTNPPGYNPSLDWIYIDQNQNLRRDYGLQNGFTENDPAYGEPIFITLDVNHNDLLDPGEKLVMLKTSKVQKVYQSDGIIRERGVDMIANEGDSYGHGTPVSGILLGGVAGVHQMAGVAPGAELLMGVNVYIADPPFIQTMEFLAPWAAAEGADIILYEDGEWIWQYMDGSSALETMIEDFHREGILQVVPAGNLATGGMHTSGIISAGDSSLAPLQVVTPLGQQTIWGTFLWSGDSAALSCQLQLPSGQWLMLPGDGRFLTPEDYQIYSQQSRSYRGTNRMDFIIKRINGLTGTFTFSLANSNSQDIIFHAYEWDDHSKWIGLTQWTNPVIDGTVTWPSTADLAFSVAAYDPRQGSQPLNNFSGRGARIDGFRLVDIAAPGSTVYSTTSSSLSYAGFTAFGGTSSAGPHVAGGAALLLELLGENRPDEIINALEHGADITQISGTLPDDSWGYGRIRLFQAAQFMLTPISSQPVPHTHDLHLDVYPNPFNSSTKLVFNPDLAGKWEILFYNIAGQLVDKRVMEVGRAGRQTVSWTVKNLSSGVFLAILKYGGHIRAIKKLSYLK